MTRIKITEGDSKFLDEAYHQITSGLSNYYKQSYVTIKINEAPSFITLSRNMTTARTVKQNNVMGITSVPNF